MLSKRTINATVDRAFRPLDFTCEVVIQGCWGHLQEWPKDISRKHGPEYGQLPEGSELLAWLKKHGLSETREGEDLQKLHGRGWRLDYGRLDDEMDEEGELGIVCIPDKDFPDEKAAEDEVRKLDCDHYYGTVGL